jgi:hypothetical protein
MELARRLSHVTPRHLLGSLVLTLAIQWLFRAVWSSVEGDYTAAALSAVPGAVAAYAAGHILCRDGQSEPGWPLVAAAVAAGGALAVAISLLT